MAEPELPIAESKLGFKPSPQKRILIYHPEKGVWLGPASKDGKDIDLWSLVNPEGREYAPTFTDKTDAVRHVHGEDVSQVMFLGVMADTNLADIYGGSLHGKIEWSLGASINACINHLIPGWNPAMKAKS